MNFRSRSLRWRRDATQELVRPETGAATERAETQCVSSAESGVVDYCGFPQSRASGRRRTDVRETLFNWLQQRVIGSRCLDLFAGSGALGLEALSRGAAHVVFVDVEAAVTRYLLGDTLRELRL
jgi:hypothetical protein